jgi:hypothetical protein
MRASGSPYRYDDFTVGRPVHPLSSPPTRSPTSGPYGAPQRDDDEFMGRPPFRYQRGVRHRSARNAVRRSSSSTRSRMSDESDDDTDEDRSPRAPPTPRPRGRMPIRWKASSSPPRRETGDEYEAVQGGGVILSSISNTAPAQVKMFQMIRTNMILNYIIVLLMVILVVLCLVGPNRTQQRGHPSFYASAPPHHPLVAPPRAAVPPVVDAPPFPA